MLKTSDVNQNALTAFAAGPVVLLYENCKLVAVTEEKKVAVVDRFSRFPVAPSCPNRIAGTPKHHGKGCRDLTSREVRDLPTSMNRERAEVMLAMCSPMSEDRS